MIEYYIKRSGDILFTITKFINGDQPSEQYEVKVRLQNGKPVQLGCECMAFKTKKTRPCKHFKMVVDFLIAGEPQPFNIMR